MKTIKITSLSQLDALVAEEVMKLGSPCFVHPVEGSWLKTGSYWLPKNGMTFGELVELYSTDIAAAWTVVEKMRADGLYPWIGTVDDEAPHWVCDSEIKCNIAKEAPTAPLAICLCALASVGIEVKLEIEV